jgi:hypothetical protein
LAALEFDGYTLLDVKTNQGHAKTAARKAERYAPQRDVYVAATEGISARQVGRFAFQFSRAKVQVSQSLTQAVRAQIQHDLDRRLARIEQGNPELTENPWECRWCGFQKVGWCEGVEPQLQLEESG